MFNTFNTCLLLKSKITVEKAGINSTMSHIEQEI